MSGSLTLDELSQQEKECILPYFSSDVAWDIGSRLREATKDHVKPVLISIANSAGLVYFQATSKPGVIPDNQHWVNRKTKTVLDFHCSTLFLGSKLRAQGRSLEDAFYKSQTEYCTHGGAFPIRVPGVEGIVGVVCVSGMAQTEDHSVIVDVLKEYVNSLK